MSAGDVHSGSLVPLPEICRDCRDRPCHDRGPATVYGQLTTCRLGIDNVPIDDAITVIGVVATDLSQTSQLRRRRSRNFPESRVRAADVRRAVEAISSVDAGMVAQFVRDRESYIAEFAKSPRVLAAVVAELKDQLDRTVSQSHDFVQLAKLVQGYVEDLIRQHDLGDDIVLAAEKLPTEGAIYFTTRLMLMKLDALRYISEPNLAVGGVQRIPIHQYVSMHHKIYDWQARQKDLDLRLTGESWARVRYQPEAVAAVIQGILDNLVKYAPAGSKANIHFVESAEEVGIRFESLGPRIEQSERAKIFLPGFRAAAAVGLESGGMGLGLASAMRISDALKLNLSVEQDRHSHPSFPQRYGTTFVVEFQKVAD